MNNIASGLALAAGVGQTRKGVPHVDMGVVGSRPPSAGAGSSTGRANSARGSGGSNSDARGYNAVGSTASGRDGAGKGISATEGHTIRLSYGMQLPGI